MKINKKICSRVLTWGQGFDLFECSIQSFVFRKRFKFINQKWQIRICIENSLGRFNNFIDHGCFSCLFFVSLLIDIYGGGSSDTDFGVSSRTHMLFLIILYFTDCYIYTASCIHVEFNQKTQTQVFIFLNTTT